MRPGSGSLVQPGHFEHALHLSVTCAGPNAQAALRVPRGLCPLQDCKHISVASQSTAQRSEACMASHRLMVGLCAPQFWHLPPVGCRLKKSPIVSIIASSVCAVMAAGLRGPMPE